MTNDLSVKTEDLEYGLRKFGKILYDEILIIRKYRGIIEVTKNLKDVALVTDIVKNLILVDYTVLHNMNLGEVLEFVKKEQTPKFRQTTMYKSSVFRVHAVFLTAFARALEDREVRATALLDELDNSSRNVLRDSS